MHLRDQLRLMSNAEKRWWTVLLIILAVALLLLSVRLCFARDPTGKWANSPFHGWFQSLKSPITGGSCCSEADCQRTEYRMGKDGYEAHIGNLWVKIPDSVVLHISNPVGEAVVCTIGDTILCFVPTLES